MKEHITYIAWDFHAHAKQRGSHILTQIAPIIDKCLQASGAFVLPPCPHPSAPRAPDTGWVSFWAPTHPLSLPDGMHQILGAPRICIACHGLNIDASVAIADATAMNATATRPLPMLGQRALKSRVWSAYIQAAYDGPAPGCLQNWRPIGVQRHHWLKAGAMMNAPAPSPIQAPKLCRHSSL